jgi:hypothetical protein
LQGSSWRGSRPPEQPPERFGPSLPPRNPEGPRPLVYFDTDFLRLHGPIDHRIDYRHVIWSLVRKPGAKRSQRE